MKLVDASIDKQPPAFRVEDKMAKNGSSEYHAAERDKFPCPSSRTTVSKESGKFLSM
jgi:hypothetical protein